MLARFLKHDPASVGGPRNLPSIRHEIHRLEQGGIARKLGKAKINIEYAYLATSPTAKTGMAVIRVSDTKKAAKLLAKREKKAAKKSAKQPKAEPAPAAK